MDYKTNKIKLLAQIVIPFAIIFVFIVTFLLNTNEKPALHHHVPSGVDFAIKINNRELIKRVLFDALFSKSALNVVKSEKEDFPSAGIRIDREVMFFIDTYKGVTFSSFLFHLSNESQFIGFIEKSNGIVGAANNGIGCVAIVPSKTDSTALDYFQSYVSDATVKNLDRTKTRIHFAAASPKALLHLFWEGQENDFIRDISLEAFIQENRIVFAGKGTKNPIIDIDTTKRHYLVLPDSVTVPYLELRTGSLPDTVNTLIQNMIKQVGLKTPRIHSEQMFIYGVEIVSFQNQNVFVPQFDGVFRFNESITVGDVHQGFSQAPNKGEVQSLKFGGTTFYVQQLSQNEIYMGTNPKPEFKQSYISNVLFVNGDPGVLLNLNGDSFFAQLAKVLPPVQNTKVFFESFETFVWKSEISEDGVIQISGEIGFPKSKSASIEMINFLLKF